MLIKSTPLKELVPVTARGEATRKKLLAAAEIEFGAKGFPAASVSSITQRADVGQGTFYLYFHSKEEVFATLVRDIAAVHCLSIGALISEPAATVERAVLMLIAQFANEQPGLHRILREAQFIDAPVFRDAQQKIIETVATVIGPAVRRDVNAKQRAAMLIGAAEHAALLGVWDLVAVGPSLADSFFG